MFALVVLSGECLRGKGPPDPMLAKPCFWQPIPSGLNLVVAAVLRDSLYVVSLLPCVAECCMLYTMCKVERFVLTIIKRTLLLLLLLLLLPTVSLIGLAGRLAHFALLLLVYVKCIYVRLRVDMLKSSNETTSFVLCS